MTGRICGTGSCVPVRYLDNNHLAEMVDTNDEWIRERTGIVRRHIADDETTVSMAVEASLKALQQSNIRPEEIDLIIVSTLSSNVVVPCAACEVQKEIKAINATCFDLNAACTGFVFGYIAAQAYITSGIYQTVLVIGSETLSNLVDWQDRSTCILFGDGAGAAVIRAETGRNYLPVTYSDGEAGAALTCTSRHHDESLENTCIKMDGQAVFKFAVKNVPLVIHEVLMKNDVSIEEIDWFILHQANQRIIDSIAKRLKIDENKFPSNVAEYGNTSSASIPLLLDEMNQKGSLQKGQKIVIAGFGGGLTWGAVVLEW